MKKKDNYNAVNELRKMLNETKKQTLKEFVMPEEDSWEEEYDDEGGQEMGDEEVLMQKNGGSGISDIEKELIQIRKIALSVINRLADQTSSESYDTMKRIWSLVDKAIESKNDESKNNNSMRRM